MSIKAFKRSTNYCCSKCGIYEWFYSKIVLEIDHINGNNNDDRIENLRYLCPNCHSQTDTWRGRNKNTGNLKVSDEEILEAISKTENIRQALILVGLVPKGLNYNRVSNLLMGRKKDFKNSQYGTVWMHNGKENKKVKADLILDYEKCGYVKGRLRIGYKVPSTKNKIWVTNGIENKMVDPNNIPMGFWEGKFNKKTVATIV